MRLRALFLLTLPFVLAGCPSGPTEPEPPPNILFAIAEAARGGPVSIRARELAQTVGLSLVVLLMGFAFWNDLSKHWQGIVGWFRDLV